MIIGTIFWIVACVAWFLVGYCIGRHTGYAKGQAEGYVRGEEITIRNLSIKLEHHQEAYNG